VLLGYSLLVTVAHAHVGRPIPSLVLPLILFMGVHEYSLARGAAVAFVLGYVTDVLGIAPVGLYTFTYVATFVLARAAGVRLAAQTTWMQVLLVAAFTLLQSVMILVLLAIFGRDPWVPRSLYPLALPHAIATAAVAPLVFRVCQALHAATAGSSRAGADGGHGVMSDLLVARSDVGEFRKRYKWMALFALLAFTVIGPPLPAPGPRRDRVRGHRAREHHPPRRAPHHARGHPRREREGARVEPPLVRRRGRPGKGDAERAPRPLPQRPRPPARSRLVAQARRHPPPQPRGAAHLRGAHPRGVRERRRQVPLLATPILVREDVRATSSPS
jgi:rod shape-determining protein MreD